MMSRLTIVSASANARSVASSSPASQVGLARLSTCPSLFDVDQRQRIARGVLVDGDHERDLLALETDLVTRQHRLGVVGDRRHPRQPQGLEVLGGDHRGHAGMGERRRGVDRDDPGVCVGAAQHRSVHHSRQADVVEVVALAADEARVLLALQAAEADRALLIGAGAGEVLLGDGHAQCTSCRVAAS
jgi:hypothetical protein